MAGYPADYGQPWIDDNGFLRFRTGEERRTKDLVEETFRVASTLTGGEKIPWLVDARAMTSADPRAWLAITERLGLIASALAIRRAMRRRLR